MAVSEMTYSGIKEKTVTGRYVTNEQINSFLESYYDHYHIETVGYSVQKRPIQSIRLGNGPKKVLMWSQMHGNESTTTKAVLDLVNFLSLKSDLAEQLLSGCTLRIVPMLNPDGAAAYTRVNANEVDLNRDAQERTQPESKVLRTIFEGFQPDFCFNLHDQRTIFSVGATPKPATVSFLAPAHDVERSISKTRGQSMQLIVAMNQVLQRLIPGQVGRYDDAFNANCVGDTFQMLDTPTILFEAGHFSEDYYREQTRVYIFQAIITALGCIGSNKIDLYNRDDYFSIPENEKLFFDILIKNAQAINSKYESEIGILFREVLKDGKISFEPKIEQQGNLPEFFGHNTYDCLNQDDLKMLKETHLWNLL